MVEDRTRIEVAFEGGAAIGVLVSAEVADALERALESGSTEYVRGSMPRTATTPSR